MKIKKLLSASGLAVSAMLLAMNSAYSDTQMQIAVSTYVGSTLQMTNSDESALDTDIALPWNPATFFATWSRSVVISSSNHTTDVQVRLLTPPALRNGSDSIPLKVKLNGTTLSTTAMTYSASMLFPAGASSGGNSIEMPLSVGADNTNPTARKPAAGMWVAAVQVVLSQAS